jgi:hypothetical protein
MMSSKRQGNVLAGAKRNKIIYIVKYPANVIVLTPGGWDNSLQEVECQMKFHLLLTALISTTALVCCLALGLLTPPLLPVMGQTNKTKILYDSGNFTGAISLLNKQLITDPHNVRILLDVGILYHDLGKRRRSILIKLSRTQTLTHDIALKKASLWTLLVIISKQ